MPKGLLRSKLFVPGARPDLFAKALASAADALSFDLEDSVPESGKAAAREAVATFLRVHAGDARQWMIVRINAPDTTHFADDLAAVVGAGPTLINLPKAESADDVRAAIASIEAVEAANDIATPLPLLVNIETPAAWRRAAEIACAHPRVVGLQLGLGDLFEPLGIDRYAVANVHAAMFAVRVAAAEAGVFALDGAFGNVRDADAYRDEARMAHRLGFIGKSCIHPSQIAIANEVFVASDAEVAAARRVIDASHDAAMRGHGAWLVDGRMIDAPFLQRAEAIVEAARAREPAS